MAPGGPLPTLPAPILRHMPAGACVAAVDMPVTHTHLERGPAHWGECPRAEYIIGFGLASGYDVHDIWLLASKQQAGIEAKQTKNDKHNLAPKDKCESASQPSWWKDQSWEVALSGSSEVRRVLFVTPGLGGVGSSSPRPRIDRPPLLTYPP
ncbi:hypothetical protein DL95DRAFT_400074 [Leptodontidium sp. 2 PMI_412]|nr:hypothetical protein DL95DRAFT_400074 [Leptodontidium sp. 2 PMI_412]